MCGLVGCLVAEIMLLPLPVGFTRRTHKESGIFLSAQSHFCGSTNEGDWEPAEKNVPVDPLEGHFAEMAEPRFSKKAHRANASGSPCNGFESIVEVQQETLSMTRLDETVSVAIVACELLPANMQNVFSQNFRLEVGYGAGFRCSTSVASPITKMFSWALDWACVGPSARS